MMARHLLGVLVDEELMIALVALGSVLYLIRFRALLPSVLKDRPSPALRTEPEVTVIVAARNAGATLRDCITSILRQVDVRLSVIAINDRSTDETSCILLAFSDDVRLRVVTITETPPSWLGKPYALHEGTRQCPTAGRLCFIDADVLLTRTTTLRCALEAQEAAYVSLLSLMPRLEAPTLWEKWCQPGFVLTLLSWYRFGRSSRHPYANGAFMLFNGPHYRAVGGHGSVRSAFNEDVALAAQMAAMGYRVRSLDGRAHIATRMYSSIRDAYRGWSRILAAAAPNGTCLVFAIIVVCAAVIGCAAGMTTAFSVATGNSSKHSVVAAAAAAYLIGVRAFRLAGGGKWTAWAWIAACGPVLIVLANATRMRFLRGAILWKGDSHCMTPNGCSDTDNSYARDVGR
jgi:hypothetical protein